MSRPLNYKCDTCGASFAKSQNFNKHKSRKTPCSPIIDTDLQKTNTCKYCGRAYSRSDSLARHLRTCTIANTTNGMDQLMVRTLQKQQEQETKIKQMAAQLEQQSALINKIQSTTGTFSAGSTFSAVSDVALLFANGPRFIFVLPPKTVRNQN